MGPPLVRLENVDVVLEGRLVLRGLDWSLQTGENWAVLGRNGSGKSTLLKLIRGELWPAPGGGGRRIYALNGEEQSSAVGIKEQFAFVSPELQMRYRQQDWTLRATQVVQSGFGGGDYVYRKLTPAQNDRVRALSRQLALEPLLARNVQTLSTGELRKVLIARALVASPRVLVCDEICDGLDAPSRAELLALLDGLARAGTQFLYTTHREEELFSALTHRMHLEQGRIVSAGPLRVQNNRTRRPLGVAKPPRSGRGAGCGHRRGPPGRAGRVLIRIEGADVYLGDEPALSGIHLEIRAGEHWAVVGANGSGKSTLLKLIAGEVHPALGGRVRRFGFLRRHSLWQIRRRVGLVSPELQASYQQPVLGWQAVASGLLSSVGLMGEPTPRQARQARRLLRELGLTPLADENITRMSYGEFRKILVARALVHGPELLLCDEPFDGLDATARRGLAGTLESAARRGVGLVVVTHHAGDVPRCTTHLLELEAGRVVYQGPAARWPGTLPPAERSLRHHA